MRKRDRTADEKRSDRLTSAGIMHLGMDLKARPKKQPFPFVLFWAIEERKGQRCKVIKSNMRVADIEFEDGHRTRVNRRAIRRSEA